MTSCVSLLNEQILCLRYNLRMANHQPSSQTIAQLVTDVCTRPSHWHSICRRYLAASPAPSGDTLTVIVAVLDEATRVRSDVDHTLTHADMERVGAQLSNDRHPAVANVGRAIVSRANYELRLRGAHGSRAGRGPSAASNNCPTCGKPW